MSLILHCGNKAKTQAEVESSPTPECTDTWYPTPHISIVRMLEEKLPSHGFNITETALSLNENGTRMFGMMNLATDNPEYSPVIGFRNAHDKMFSQGIICGSSVFVCDNLAFSSEIKFQRRHTRNIDNDFPGIIDKALDRLSSAQEFQNRRIENYKRIEIEDAMAHHIIIRAMKDSVYSPSKITKVVEKWDRPPYAEFEPRTLWSLFNAVTEILKGGNIWTRADNTQILHKLFDNVSEEITGEIIQLN